LYTYPVARAPRLQGKLVVQARSKKEKSRGKKEGEKRKGEKGAVYTTCPWFQTRPPAHVPALPHSTTRAPAGRHRQEEGHWVHDSGETCIASTSAETQGEVVGPPPRDATPADFAKYALPATFAGVVLQAGSSL
jgi:hypothetical protein